MKIKGQKRRSAAKPTAEQATTTPEVIELPDGTADAAKDVMAASDIPLGPSEPISRSEGDNLYEAATDPAKALGGKPDIRTVPVEPIDVEFDEVPNTEAEMAAQKLLDDLEAEDTGKKKEHPAEVLWTTEKDPIESAFANGMYTLISEGGQELLNQLKDVGKHTMKFVSQVKLRIIAFGNSVVDATMKAGNAVWKLHDDLKKNPAAPYLWLKAQQVNLATWYVNTSISLHSWWLERASGSTKTAIRDLTQVILDLKALHEQELRRMSKRISTMERQLDKNTRAALRLSNTSSPIDADQLKTLMAAVSQGRKVDTVNLVRAITGSTLATAKSIVEEASAPLN